MWHADGRLTIDQHGNRRVVRVERDESLTVLADRYQGKRLNSPNDLVYFSDGGVYFTDPPFGLPRFDDDPHKEWGNKVMTSHTPPTLNSQRDALASLESSASREWLVTNGRWLCCRHSRRHEHAPLPSALTP